MATRTLGDICDEVGGVIRTGPFGSQLHESDYKETGTPVVMPKNIVGGQIVENGIARIDKVDVSRLGQHRLRKGDIVYGRRGDIGRRALITEREDGWLCGTGCLRLSLGDNELDPTFLYYYLGRPDVTAWIYNQAVGATIPNLNTDIIRNVSVTYPSLDEQRRIASILSAYDDLIENNTRRIKILEEIAQSLYREWFINFRFPGHEKIKMVDSPFGKIPEGWEIVSLGSQLAALESGKRPKGGAKESEAGIPSVGAENVLGIGRHNYQNEKYVNRDFFERMKKGVVNRNVVALYKDGAYIGRSAFFRDGFPHAEFCVNEHVFLLDTSGARLTNNILYLWLQEATTISAIRATNANAAQPGINQKGVMGLKFVAPTEDVVQGFDQEIDPCLALIITLAKANEALHRTRDLLLPKLISGEISVE